MFSSLIRSPNVSIQRFTSAGYNGSPVSTTYLIALNKRLPSLSFSNERNTDGTQCNTSTCSVSNHSASLSASRITFLLSGAQTAPPEHNGTNTSFKNPSNDGDASWLTRVPGPAPTALISQRMKWSIPFSRPRIAFGVPVDPEVK